MLTYLGINALSGFRRQKLLKDLQKINRDIKGLSAEYIHFVDTKRPPNTSQKRTLKNILSYGAPFKNDRAGTLFLVVPRSGTISPWSSKATDIARNVGLGSAIRRIERGIAYYIQASSLINRQAVAAQLHDRMTEAVLENAGMAKVLFDEQQPRPVQVIDVLTGERETLTKANVEMGLALNDQEIEYVYKIYKKLKRNPTDVELMSFSQINSEHARHKIFNAKWIVDDKEQAKSLFQMIKNTYTPSNKTILSAYSDNAAVLAGPQAERFFSDPASQIYRGHKEAVHLAIKAETHNHPTAISPAPGAATGTGGEIRDEGTAGQGSKPKTGMAGYTVSNLNLPGARRPWEKIYGKPSFMASPLDIMIEAPLGASGYGNEYGRPTTAGYFRTFEQQINGQIWGYHKPIMIAGGIGNIRHEHVHKKAVPSGALVIQLGGPAMLIGLGGAAGSSMQSGQSSENLDFASVQRANAEMQRRAQEVIDYCWALGPKNPILSIHDVGGGGLATALSELVYNAGLGARFELRDIPNAEPGLSPLEIWCNESQERYVLIIKKSDLKKFTKVCLKERCPFAVVGHTTKEKRLTLNDSHFDNMPIDLPLVALLGNPPKMVRKFKSQVIKQNAFSSDGIDIEEAVERVLKLPAVASKKFLITIGDRTVSGVVARDQMVGPWQVPVSDVSVTSSTIGSPTGEAMAMGERPNLALIEPGVSVRMAIGEAITNIAAASIGKLSDVKLSANWMAAAGVGNEDQKLYEGVRAAGEEFCPALSITIPVGKDSLSMRTFWKEDGNSKSVVSPLSLVVTAFASVANISRTLTPQLKNCEGVLILIDLGGRDGHLGGSALAQVYNQVGNRAPDIKPQKLKAFFTSIQQLNSDDKILAYHDRSDGGLLVTLCEMAFASRCGLDIQLNKVPGQPLEQLFNEGLGAVIQIRLSDKKAVVDKLRSALGPNIYEIGRPTKDQTITIKNSTGMIYQNSRARLEAWWADTSYRIQRLRDNPACADEEFQTIADDRDSGLFAGSNFSLSRKRYRQRPRVAILREQGVNGHIEMAAAFDMAGFRAVDVHMTDLLSGNTNLKDFKGAAACGGFSYGDVLGAGEGWAKTILFNKQLRGMFISFFNRQDTFSLGVCNGCQMFAALKELIPGAESWPRFLKNWSEQFEARVVMLKINDSPSIFFRGLTDSYLPIPVAHGEGRAEFERPSHSKEASISAQYVDSYKQVTTKYPFNPNGSPDGIAALTTPDGRATIIMPHPERAFLTYQHSWHPKEWGEYAPWFKIFQNARHYVH